jgi:hypothetical protein
MSPLTVGVHLLSLLFRRLKPFAMDVGPRSTAVESFVRTLADATSN